MLLRVIYIRLVPRLCLCFSPLVFVLVNALHRFRLDLPFEDVALVRALLKGNLILLFLDLCR